MVIDIIVTPESRDPGRPLRKARFIAAMAVGGRVLGAFSAPLCGSARVLLSEGVQPETELRMRHAGSDVVALAATVGVAACLTVNEDASTGAPRFARWRAFSMAEAA